MNVRECKNYEDLALDEACLVLRTTAGNNSDDDAAARQADYNATLYSLSSDCLLCPYSKVSSIRMNTSIIFSTAESFTWRVYNDSGIQDYRPANDESGIICQFQPNLGEYGIYELTIDDEGCEFDAIREPPDHLYTPLAIIFGSLLCLLLSFSAMRLCRSLLLKNKWFNKVLLRIEAAESNYSCSAAPVNETNDNNYNKRVLSIDTFRGLSILTMIFVNNGAGGYAFLEHATWNGLYVGDLVFPSFLWIMGVCIPISLSSQLARSTRSRFSIARRILKRSILLFLIDLSLNTLATDSDLKKIRIFGVLQRFAVAYSVVGLLYTFLSTRNEIKYSPDQERTSRFVCSTSSGRFIDFVSLVPQWIVIFAITALHCAITFCLPVPGCPTGYLGPGGRHADGRYSNCTGGAAGYLDKIILGNDHIYQRPTIDDVYGSGPFDPEGILGCLTTILQTFIGVQTGKILRVYGGWKDRVVRWLVLALVCGCVGSALHSTDTIPVNKNLWSLSFVFVATSFALILLTAIYLLVDVMAIWGGGPFRIPGMNALVMYIGHRICHQIFPFHWKYGEITIMSHTWRTIAAVWDVGAWTIVAYILHRKRIYISL